MINIYVAYDPKKEFNLANPIPSANEKWIHKYGKKICEIITFCMQFFSRHYNIFQPMNCELFFVNSGQQMHPIEMKMRKNMYEIIFLKK